MRTTWNTLGWLGFIGLLLLLAGPLYLGSSEVYLYLTQSEAKAQAAAQTMFKRICDREGLDPRSFHGPERPSVESDKKLDAYTFVWARSPDETITISVTYLPYDLPYSISESIIERKHDVGKLR